MDSQTVSGHFTKGLARKILKDFLSSHTAPIKKFQENVWTWVHVCWELEFVILYFQIFLSADDVFISIEHLSKCNYTFKLVQLNKTTT